MSLLPTNVYSGYQGDPASGPALALQPNLGQLLYVSTISTFQINLDGNLLDTTGSGGNASLLLNGSAVATASALTSSLANWAQFGANSTITFATGGGSGGAINMNSGTISTLNSAALNVSSINGTSFNQKSSGVSKVITGNSSVSNAGAGFETLTFGVNNSVPLTAGTWYLLTSKINTTINSATINSGSWFFRYGLSGGTLTVQDSPVFLAPVVWAQQNSSDSNQFSYFYSALGYCVNSGSIASLSVIATLSGTSEDQRQWTCPQFDITPLGPSLN